MVKAIQTYEGAGVSIHRGDDLVRRIKGKVRETFSRSVLADIGSFGGFYDARFKGFRSPVLVSSMDGVGTKLKVAFMMDKHDTVGEDLVNHCVNDIAVCGARPLFFMDYFATGKLKTHVAERVIDGMIRGCLANGCSLIGGETAEMPGFYRDNEYDLAGSIVGVVDRKNIYNGSRVRAGDVLVGIPSTGLHTNGYSLARSVLFDRFEADDFIDELGGRVGDVLLAVHRSYLAVIALASKNKGVHAFAHITGGGIAGNTGRVVPAPLSASINWAGWEMPAIFRLIAKYGPVPDAEMRKAFNLGIGLVIVVAKSAVDRLVGSLKAAGEYPLPIGEVVRKL
ncbi:MAG TPA: phosphoribosylformylglycinamidine cyclo-ligase [Bacteroidota bacterium]|nr:phosphoribosylformylglycinamidine cyclo-ligase [Bacteroidota bacterium]